MRSKLRRVTPHQKLPAGGIVGSFFDRGSNYTNWRPEGTDDWLLIYTHAGRGEIRWPNGRVVPVVAGDCLLYEPGAYQDYATAKVAGRWVLYWAHFRPRPDWIPWLRWTELAAGTRISRVVSAASRKAIKSALQRMVATGQRARLSENELGRNALEEAILWIRSSAASPTGNALDERIGKAMDFLADNIKAPFSLSQLARHCGISASRLGHLFSDHFRMGPQRFGEELRLRHAQQLLRQTSLSVTEVAAETGFSDVFYFSRRFKKYARVSPRAWQRKRSTAGGGCSD